jgi:nitrate/nitrite transporter NarK
LTVLGMALFGMGNGAVFQLVPQRFRQHLGARTGVVGAWGGWRVPAPRAPGDSQADDRIFRSAFALFGVAAFGAAAWLQWLVSREEGGGNRGGARLDFAEEA